MILAAIILASFRFAEPDALLLRAWRTTDSKGAACASCHSPDGIELSAFGFDKEDLLRRASRHLDEDRRSLVVRLILAGRTHFPDHVADPMQVRPLQPGGKVLPGVTPEARDAAFSERLSELAPALLGPPIHSLEEAKKVEGEVLGIDLDALPVGIEMNRLSEDGFHGEEHASLAHWIPDVPLPTTPEVIAAQERYLESPKQSTLRALDAEIKKAFRPSSGIESLALNKYRSLLVLQHRLRVQAGLAPAELGANVLPEGNPFWQIAEVGRQYADSGAELLSLPADVAKAKSGGPQMGEQMKALRLPWYWLGWISDPTLQHSGFLQETRRADYFTLSLLHDGPYVSHAVFMLARKLFQQALPGPSTGMTRPFEIQFSFLVLERPLIEREPVDPAAKARFRRLAGNAFRASLWLLVDQLERRKETVFPESQRLQIRTIEAYLEAIGEPEKALADKAIGLLAGAKVLGRAGNG